MNPTSAEEVQLNHKSSAAPPRPEGSYDMAPPTAPYVHPDNSKAASLWRAEEDHKPEHNHQPRHYTNHLYYEYPPNDSISWTDKAKALVSNIWKHPEEVPPAVDIGAMVRSGCGRFGCYLSTRTGPIAGTLYVTGESVAFCSDVVLIYTAPSGQRGWNYYYVRLHRVKIGAVNQNVKEDERYIRIDTVDNYHFWFMGFYDHRVVFDQLWQHHGKEESGEGRALPVVGASGKESGGGWSGLWPHPYFY